MTADDDAHTAILEKLTENNGMIVAILKGLADRVPLVIREHQHDRSGRPFGPMQAENVRGNCAACEQPFKEGDYTTLVPLGPGECEEARQRCAKGRPYNAVAAHVHYACANGTEPDDAHA